MIYEPQEDSYLLEKHLEKYVNKKSVLDMGTGSGIQAKSALRHGANKVLAVDIDPKCVSFVKRKKISAIESDLFSNIRGKYDVIVFNPPYLPLDDREDKESQQITTGGIRGDELITRFLRNAKRHLSSKGVILLIVSSLAPKNNIMRMLKSQSLKRKCIDRESFFMETIELWEITKSQ